MALAPLQTHSTHSLLRGVPSVVELVSGARRLGYSALALTDVNTMAGSILFLQECRQQGIRPILGLELADSRDPSIRVVLLSRNGSGYGDLCELATLHNLGTNGPDLDNLFIRQFPDLFALCPHPELLQRLGRTPLRRNLFGAICLVDPPSAARSRAVEAICNWKVWRPQLPTTAGSSTLGTSSCTDYFVPSTGTPTSPDLGPTR
jgi:hypothetical protein